MLIRFLSATSIFFASLTPGLAQTDTPPSLEKPLEIHVISVANPQKQDLEPIKPEANSDRKNRKELVKIDKVEPILVEVDRPGKHVHLVLLSETSMQWTITHTEETSIDVSLYSSSGRPKASLDEMFIRDVEAIRRILPQDTNGPAFHPAQRIILDSLAKKGVDAERLSSFQGDEFARPSGYLVNDVEYIQTPSEFAQFIENNLSEPAQIKRTLPLIENKQAEKTKNRAQWRLDTGFSYPKGNREIESTYPNEYSGFSDPIQATARSEDKIWGILTDPYNALYEYTIPTQSWTRTSLGTNNIAQSLYYDEQTERLFILFYNKEMSRLEIVDFKDTPQQILTAPLQDFPGLSQTLESEREEEPIFEIMGKIEGHLFIKSGAQQDNGRTRHFRNGHLYSLGLENRIVKILKAGIEDLK